MYAPVGFSVFSTGLLLFITFCITFYQTRLESARFGLTPVCSFVLEMYCNGTNNPDNFRENHDCLPNARKIRFVLHIHRLRNLYAHVNHDSVAEARKI